MPNDTDERIRLEGLEQLKILRPIDDFFMRELFRDNKELTEFVLRTITDIPDLEITEEHSQHDLHRLNGARSVCLDVFAKDSKGRVYNLEIQRSGRGADPRRARYHSSSIDVELLDSGEDFSKLPITYVIFITETDVFGEGKLIYPIDRMNRATGKPFDDGEHIVYMNASYVNDNDSSDLAKLAHDFLCPDADEMFLPIMAERTAYFKINPKGVEYMSKNMDEWGNKLRQEGIKEGIKEGRHENAIETAINLLAEGIGKLELIARATGLSLEEVQAIAEGRKPIAT
ncbi:MAG: Rpn family recombination-promoting nuclease/putative transposase [Ruminococcus sp.]|nr:Rpn family recombination-promoting nuclease/putative transposase [Ruminococcus sp.]